LRSPEADGLPRAGALLTDPRRVNVALTRARRKLVLVGSLSTLTGSAAGDEPGLLRQTVALMREQGWVVPLPADALSAFRRYRDVPTKPATAAL
jgi:DNA replication ATP-dependent helicase Dna2